MSDSIQIKFKSPLSDSKFNAWRACVSVIHIDGNIDNAERLWFEKRLEIIPFNDEQKAIIINDFENPTTFEEIITKVTDKRDKAFVLDNMRVLCHIDGIFGPNEKTVFKRFEEAVLKGVDLSVLEAQIALLEKESYKIEVTNKDSLFDQMITKFKFIVDGDGYDNPDD